MRLDKYISGAADLSRKEAGAAVRRGRVTVDGQKTVDPAFQVPDGAAVAIDGKEINYREFYYIMLNKPEGYVSSTDDPGAPTVMELLPPELRKKGLFPCGRLDRYTTGLMILTNDGAASHRALSPKSHVEKVYSFTCRGPLERTDELEKGVHIEGGYLTKPCRVEKTGEREGIITLREGKYHQIKQMLEAVGNKVIALERISFAGIPLDRDLAPGEWRELTPEEEKKFTESYAKEEQI